MLEERFRFVRVSGEISNLSQPLSGHCYFNLKDESSQLNAVLFKNQQRWLAHNLANGQQVICDGRITIYEPRGQYQLIVDTVDFDGTGRLRLEFERLKQQLRSEGLFDASRKKNLPESIHKIVLITSPSGAAVHDFLSICRKRQADLLVQIFPVQVQGDNAADQISRAIELSRELDPDVLVLCRGGGSIEDLWAFNEERLARAIHASAIPVVTAIGHETDFTIADFCADLRAATPTAAAQLLTTDQASQRSSVQALVSRLRRALEYRLSEHTHRLAKAAHVLSTFDQAFSRHTFKLDYILPRLYNGLSRTVEKKHAQITSVHSLLLKHDPTHRIKLRQQQVSYLGEHLTRRMHARLESSRTSLSQIAAVLDTLSPLATLARGYSVVSKISSAHRRGPIVTSIDQVEVNEKVEIRLRQGFLDCEIISKKDQ